MAVYPLLIVFLKPAVDTRYSSKFLVKQFIMFNIAHLSKLVVNVNLIIVRTKMHYYFTDFFCSVVARVLRTFTFFRKRFRRDLIFGMTTMAFGLGKISPGQKRIEHTWQCNMHVDDEAV